MANLWQFFGLPDPDSPDKKEGKTGALEPTKPSEVIEKVIAAKVIEDKKRSMWRGAMTPDGDRFHDMAEPIWSKSQKVVTVERGLRYVTPDDKYRLPLRGMEQRLQEGDVLVVDLRKLVHMDAHQNACRRMLKELSDSLNLPAFALDEEERILLMPGCGITIDICNHDLGLMPIIH